jgi:hypothetical protein
MLKDPMAFSIGTGFMNAGARKIESDGSTSHRGREVKRSGIGADDPGAA